MISKNPIWYTPVQAYSDYSRMVEEVGLDKVNTLGKYQKVRETRAVAVLCSAMYIRMGTPWYLQLVDDESTDARVMRTETNNPGHHELLNVEVTTYMADKKGELPKESALQQLKKTKTFDTHHKYGQHDVVLVELGNLLEVDFDEIAEYLRSINAPYQLWFIQQVEHDNPDTIAELTTCTPAVYSMRMNIGESFNEQFEQNIRGVLRTKRVGNVAKVGKFSTKTPIKGAPWENM